MREPVTEFFPANGDAFLNQLLLAVHHLFRNDLFERIQTGGHKFSHLFLGRPWQADSVENGIHDVKIGRNRIDQRPIQIEHHSLYIV